MLRTFTAATKPARCDTAIDPLPEKRLSDARGLDTPTLPLPPVETAFLNVCSWRSDMLPCITLCTAYQFPVPIDVRGENMVSAGLVADDCIQEVSICRATWSNGMLTEECSPRLIRRASCCKYWARKQKVGYVEGEPTHHE